MDINRYVRALDREDEPNWTRIYYQNYMQEKIPTTKVSTLLGHGGTALDLFVVAEPHPTLPPGFPNKELKLPEGWNKNKMTIILDNFPAAGLLRSDAENSEVVRETLQLQKLKKRNSCYPNFTDPPKKIGDYYFRHILMYRDKKKPVLYIGYDDDASRLDKGFWTKALNYKSKHLNPKSATATVPSPKKQ